MTGHTINVEDINRAGIASSSASETLTPATLPAGTSVPYTGEVEASVDEPRTLSFAELKELIEQGKTDQIPNNRVIPNDLNVSLGSSCCRLFNARFGTLADV